MDLGSFREREQIDTQRENEEEEEIFKNEFKSENGPNDCVDCSGVVHDSDRCIVDDEEDLIPVPNQTAWCENCDEFVNIIETPTPKYVEV